MKILLKGARVISPQDKLNAKVDILIAEGKIQEISEEIQVSGARVYKLDGLVIVPGLIDMHVHLREPGREDAEDIISGAEAAARGGFVAVACMPNTEPPLDNPASIRYVKERARKAKVHVFPVGAFTIGRKGEQLTEMALMVEEGAVAFSDDGSPVSNPAILRRGLEYLLNLGKVYIDHAEEPALSQAGVANESWRTVKAGLRGIPWVAEAAAVARDILIAEYVSAPIHIAHVSTARSIEIIKDARRKGLQVTAEVTPHHLTLTDEAVLSYDTNYKMNPPLRSEEDRQALVEALADGTIDVIASDHAPHILDEKEKEFDYAPFGVIGLETTVPVILDRFVNSGIISLERFVELLSVNPARILGLEGFGIIREGARANLTVLNPAKEITIDRNKFASKSRNTPFHGWKLKGAVAMTIVEGKVVWEAL